MRVFVYGTLMSGCGNHRLLTGAQLVAIGKTKPVYRMLHLGGFPAIVDGGSTAIHGEVYEVSDPECLAALDRLEGHPYFYKRTEVELADGMVASLYILQRSYLRDGHPVEEIPTGNWRDADRGSEMRS